MASVTMRSDHLRTRLTAQRRSGALWLTLEGEPVRNALDTAVYRQLLDHLGQAEGDPAVRAVVLTGAGAAFCSGMNLKAAQHEDTEERGRLAATAMHRLRALGKPTIAAVNGSAVGAGVGLVLCCDVAIASTTARFSVPEIRIGILPTSVAPLLVDAVGPREAKRLLLVGDDFDAHEAHRIGILHEVVADDELHLVVDRYLRSIEAGGAIEIAATKTLVDACGRPGIAAEEISRITQQVAEARLNSDADNDISAPKEGTFRHDG